MEIPSGEQESSSPVKTTVPIEFVFGDSRTTSDWEQQDTVKSMKQYIAETNDLSLQHVDLSYNGELLSDATRVEELGGDSSGLTLTVHVIQQSNKSHVMPESLIVRVAHDKEVTVNIQKQTMTKPFLGGYRHKLSGVQYHNASTQTLSKRPTDNGVVKYQRDTQTVLTKHKRQQVHVDAATQMNKTGCFVGVRQDKVISASGAYETADDYHARLRGHVITLQTYWRQWLAKRYVNGLRRDKALRDQWEREEAARRIQEREQRAHREFERRMNPRTKDDFDLLYHALEMWRVDELRAINESTSGPERKAALCELLEQEAQLIASIGKHKIEAGKEHKKKAMEKFLDATAAPRRWIAFDGGITEMDTQFSLRAQQLRDIYQSITMDGVSRDERLDILLTLKCTVKEHDCKLTRELVELVDREADLLVRGLDTKDSLQGLRKRIAGLFFQYCKVPMFNPEAAKHNKVPQDPATLRANIYYCRSCCRYLSSTEFELSSNSRMVGHCRQCRELDNCARGREDLTIYRAMLTSIRKSEEGFGDNSQIAFLVQEADLRYLTENIWAGQSVLSGETDLCELRLVRWERNETWTPWNTILLTEEEAHAHSKLDSVLEAYGTEFVRKVHYRHILARSYFSRIPEMTGHMSTKVNQLPLPRPKEREIQASNHTTDNC